ncbi:MAG: MarR family transcriptional regulator [Novosphingobium sp.]
MDGQFDSRSALIGLVDEVTRLSGRLKSTFAASRREAGLGESEMMVLNAVVEAGRAPTVAQIGRSMGQPRQIVQRAANSLVEAGLIATAVNPDHKRAVLLRATDKGVTLKREADARAEAIAAELTLDLEATRAATLAVRAVRKQLEARIRGEDIE